MWESASKSKATERARIWRPPGSLEDIFESGVDVPEGVEGHVRKLYGAEATGRGGSRVEVQNILPIARACVRALSKHIRVQGGAKIAGVHKVSSEIEGRDKADLQEYFLKAITGQLK